MWLANAVINWENRLFCWFLILTHSIRFLQKTP